MKGLIGLLKDRKSRRQEEKEVQEIAKPIENIEEELSQIRDFLNEFKACGNEKRKQQIANLSQLYIYSMASRMIEVANCGVTVNDEIYERTIGILKIVADEFEKHLDVLDYSICVSDTISKLQGAYRT